jgi:hypothetical protein
MNKKEIIYYVILIILLLSVFYLISLMKSETSQCLKNPFVYGAKKMKNVSCSCTQFSSNGCFPMFNFDDTNFTFQERNCGGVGLDR